MEGTVDQCVDVYWSKAPIKESDGLTAGKDLLLTLDKNDSVIREKDMEDWLVLWS